MRRTSIQATSSIILPEDGVAVGSQGRRGLSRMLLRSVAQALLRRSGCLYRSSKNRLSPNRLAIADRIVEERGVMATLFSALVFALIIALFALQNTAMVTVRFLSWEHEASVVLVVIGAACLAQHGHLPLHLATAFGRRGKCAGSVIPFHSQAERIRLLASQAQKEQASFPPDF